MKIYLSFNHFWRDFRALRGVLLQFDMHLRVAGCHVASRLEGFPEYDFLLKETLAAATDSELPNEEMTRERRVYLVDHGVRGFLIKCRPDPHHTTG